MTQTTEGDGRYHASAANPRIQQAQEELRTDIIMQGYGSLIDPHLS
jgi:hypothetical protein